MIDPFLESLAVNLYPPTNVEQAIRFVDFRSYLPGAVLSKVDRMAMQVSLEVRTPFLRQIYLNYLHGCRMSSFIEEVR